jgi:hypothetical protein
MGLGDTWRPWSEIEDQTLLDLCAMRTFIGDAWREVAAKFEGRSPVACRQRYRLLRRKAAGEPLPERPQRQRRYNGRKCREALSRLPETVHHVSLTAEIFGDPLPGRSALDRRQQIEAESNRALFDRRYSDFRPAITLATGPLR